MKAFLAMVRFNFKSMMITAFSVGRSKKKAATGIASFVFMSVLMLFISATYSFSMAMAMGTEGLPAMLGLMMLVGLLFSLALTVYSAQGSIFGTKDIDLVLSWPVSAFSVMLARVLALYFQTALLFIMFMVPAGVVYFVMAATSPLIFIPLLLISLFVPLVSCAISVLIGGIISYIASRFRYKNLFTVLLSLLFMGGIFVASFQFNRALGASGAIDGAALQQVLFSKFPPIYWAVNAIIYFDVAALLKVVAISLVPFLLVVWVFSHFYKSILTHLTSQHMKANYKLTRVGASGSFTALLKKEARRFFGTPIYILNAGISPLLALGGSVYLLILKLQGNTELAGIAMVLGGQLPAMLLLGACFFIAITCTAAVSISMEGKSVWILKSAPISCGKIFAVKAGFNFLLCSIIGVLVMPLVGVSLSIPMAQIGLIFVACCLMGLVTSMWGLFVNLLLPKMDGENDTAIVKRSASMVVGTFSGMGLGGLLLVLQFVFQQLQLGFYAYASASIGILLALATGCFLLLKYKGTKLFAKL